MNLDQIYIKADGQLSLGDFHSAAYYHQDSDHFTSLIKESFQLPSKSSHSDKKQKSISPRDTASKATTIPNEYLHLVAPEILFGGNLTPHATIYAFGIVACIMLTGKPLIKVNTIIME